MLLIGYKYCTCFEYCIFFSQRPCTRDLCAITLLGSDRLHLCVLFWIHHIILPSTLPWIGRLRAEGFFFKKNKNKTKLTFCWALRRITHFLICQPDKEIITIFTVIVRCDIHHVYVYLHNSWVPAFSFYQWLVKLCFFHKYLSPYNWCSY